MKTATFAMVAIILGASLLAGCAGIGQAASFKTVSADEAAAKIKANPSIRLVDVRASFEFRTSHIEGASLLPLPQVESRARAQFNAEDEIVLYCQSGERSAEAAKILANLGYANVYNLAGGIEQWRARGYPLVQ